MKKTRKPGGGRKKLKPEYDAGKNLKEQMESAVALYNSEMSLQAIGDELGLNPRKVEQLTIFRRRKIGFIFQNYNLVPVLNVYENIVLPVELDGNKYRTLLKNTMKHKTTKPPYSQPQQLLTYP